MSFRFDHYQNIQSESFHSTFSNIENFEIFHKIHVTEGQLQQHLKRDMRIILFVSVSICLSVFVSVSVFVFVSVPMSVSVSVYVSVFLSVSVSVSASLLVSVSVSVFIFLQSIALPPSRVCKSCLSFSQFLVPSAFLR